MTDGILLGEMQRDRFLRRYDTIIIDEAHERSLNIDHPGLSQTAAAAAAGPQSHRHVGHHRPRALPTSLRHRRSRPRRAGRRIIEVSGRTYPVEVRYRLLVDLSPTARRLSQNVIRVAGVVDAVEELWTDPPGSDATDIPCFFSGNADPRRGRCAHRLETARHRGCRSTRASVPLSTASSDAADSAASSWPRTSRGDLVDRARHRLRRQSTPARPASPATASGPRQRLPIEPISKASAQRTGRCGVGGRGHLHPALPTEDFEGSPDFTEAEVQRTSGLRHPADDGSWDSVMSRSFLVDAPDPRQVADGARLLEEPVHSPDAD